MKPGGAFAPPESGKVTVVCKITFFNYSLDQCIISDVKMFRPRQLPQLKSLKEASEPSKRLKTPILAI
jgi:hypothetical protein